MKTYIAPVVSIAAVVAVSHTTPWVAGFYPLIAAAVASAVSGKFEV